MQLQKEETFLHGHRLWGPRRAASQFFVTTLLAIDSLLWSGWTCCPRWCGVLPQLSPHLSDIYTSAHAREYTKTSALALRYPQPNTHGDARFTWLFGLMVGSLTQHAFGSWQAVGKTASGELSVTWFTRIYTYSPVYSTLHVSLRTQRKPNTCWEEAKKPPYAERWQELLFIPQRKPVIILLDIDERAFGMCLS